MIKSIHFSLPSSDKYPFDIPSFQGLKVLSLNQPITVFVGSNGSGKSTLLKAIAYYNDSINVSKHDMTSAYFSDSKDLSKHMTISYSIKTRNGFFFSGEDFITYINNLKAMKQQLHKDIAEIKKEFKGKNKYALTLALGPLQGQLYELNQTYDGDLHERSHGEGFLSFFKARMHKKGLYLLDEPETPLSAVNQYQLLVLLTDLARSGSQIIIATHSPILMALKDAVIYRFDDNGIDKVAYEDIESVQFTKYFLNDKDHFINRI